MSAAYKCDKCSQYKDGKPFAIITFTRPDEDKPWTDPRGVCLECAREMSTSKEQAEEQAKRAAQSENLRLEAEANYKARQK